MNKLYFKLSALLFGLFLMIGLAYVAISSYLNDDYLAEMHQRLYGSIASHTVAELSPMVDGRVDTMMIQDIMHSMMVINPSVEVYLLRPDGEIVTYVAPNKRVQLERVDLEPIHAFIAAPPQERPFLKGDDPRNPGRANIFSAAEVRNATGALEGYVYIILSGEEQALVAGPLQSSYILRQGTFFFFLSLALAFVVSLLVMRYLTRNLRRIETAVHRFQEGDYAARIDADAGGEFAAVATTFNGMADQITASIDELKSLDTLRRELIANISHDLRTPLAIIQGFVETLLMKTETLPPEERRKHLNTILNSAERLSGLIGQLFEYSKLEARQIVPQKEAFNVGELAQDVAHKFSVLASAKGVNIRLDVPQALPHIFADLSLVERVLNNLMDNALKFTPAGGEVLLEMRADATLVRIKVADTGPGIPEAELPFVFDRYRKVKRTRDGQNPGAGLGLAIVKSILELHDQRIRIHSKLKEGTSFCFELPLRGELAG
ncbi:ATP-binding protein [Neolewinella lacunae]|uniref:histidine kinase n=1 Tax=Neolewinella lacunae TaxID=1517758 RepID=A0A923PKS0_9BACT|nr:ATP-binding protein [Neolewinella lacunae]MBC6993496.1 HAMP domain-containing histidine kinase [Neolewinella lacunae]MDN3636228.1 ATP-binding protein [Neolewinella lacunae]